MESNNKRQLDDTITWTGAKKRKSKIDDVPPIQDEPESKDSYEIRDFLADAHFDPTQLSFQANASTTYPLIIGAPQAKLIFPKTQESLVIECKSIKIGNFEVSKPTRTYARAGRPKLSEMVSPVKFECTLTDNFIQIRMPAKHIAMDIPTGEAFVFTHR